jgi:hypothetical protein
MDRMVRPRASWRTLKRPPGAYSLLLGRLILQIQPPLLLSLFGWHGVILCRTGMGIGVEAGNHPLRVACRLGKSRGIMPGKNTRDPSLEFLHENRHGLLFSFRMTSEIKADIFRSVSTQMSLGRSIVNTC